MLRRIRTNKTNLIHGWRNCFLVYRKEFCLARVDFESHVE